ALQGNVSASSNTTPGMFFLTGIPGLEAMHRWISIPFSAAFAVALLGNSTLLYVIRTEPSLHKPMFYFLSMLAVTDLALSLTTLPKMLGVFWFEARAIPFAACLAQMFFLHTFSIVESAVLLAMAFDRYVAVCHPLRYGSILSGSLVLAIGLVALLRAVGLMLPLPLLLRRLPYCGSHVVAHCYCEHMAVVKLACTDTTVNNVYGILVTFFIGGFDILGIGHSYVRILRTVFSLATREEKMKALGTCLDHICAILVFYTPAILSSVIHRFGHHIAPHVHILMANLYLLLPPVMNPIVYGMKTKQIRERVRLVFTRKRF
ncbi:O52K1 protein, partial [Crypturellus soui]|nr:O52K1 protein [Crypturellus soui]